MKNVLKLLGAILVFTFGLLSQVFHAAPPATAFGELPIIYDAAISPNGSKLAAIVNVNGDYRVAVQNFGDSKRQGKPWTLSLGKEIKPKIS